MHQFASGFQRNYYGKGDVTVYRLNGGIFGANVTMLLFGDAFWPTYTTGDNTGLVATDSMKNFIQRETANFCGSDLDSYCRFLAEKFLVTYPQTGGIQITATEIPYDGDDVFTPAGPDRATARIEMTAAGIVEARSGIRGFKLLRLGGSAFYGFVRDQYTTLPETHNRPLHMWLDLESYCRFLAEKFFVTYPQTGGIQITAAEIPYDGDDVFTPSGPDRATARIEMTAAGIVEVRSGIRGFKLLRLGGSAFYGFVRDQYTTLPETHNRPLHMWLDLEWLYTRPEAAFQSGRVTSCVRGLVASVFRGFESGSIQQVIYQIGSKLLDELPELAEVTLEANNRTWDLAAESVYTDPRPPYGILGLTLRR